MAKKKKKMGRPPLKPKDRRTAITTLRLTKTDRNQLEKEAAARGLSLSSYLMQCWQKVRAKK
jgi:predicted HicB family RNase H-like nuclease